MGATHTRDPDTGLSPAERELLRLLGSGLTDEAASNRLGVAVRTVRRQMASVMERLGAASRFEAGLKAEPPNAAGSEPSHPETPSPSPPTAP
ncbi:helix-turn-helix transcriptional regulator [Streptomyces sp. ISL-87]|uniref:helix-turn-helix domain-containing protein n=1 Tax=Streptomyces sp. ISL-87 TaxID=2819188 RepID=UPI0027E56B28|nr:helix-turn-helix transcriptional regulator [Streptomyces sp. ISL-87]